MSKISTAYDAILSTLTTLFPNKTKIPLAYELENNQEMFLRNGYGVVYLAESPLTGELNSIINAHNIGVVFVREVLRLDSDANEIDLVTKELLEDVFTLRDELFSKPTLESSAIDIIDLSTTNGIEFVVVGKNNFASLLTTFDVRVREISPC